MDTNTLDTKVNQNVRSGMQNKAVKTYLHMISSNFSVKNRQISENRAIQALLDSTFLISSPDGTAKLNSQRLYQAIWRVANRMKPLDFMLHGSGRPPFVEKIATQGLSTVLDRGGYGSGMRDKNGVFFSMLMYGDGFMQVGVNPNKKSKAPILFTPVSCDSVYMDNFATGMRNRGMAGSAYRGVAIFSYSWNQACELFPKLKKIGGIGKIPREQTAWLKSQERSWEQSFNLEDEVEIGFGYDIHKKNFTIFAGEACTVLEEYNGDEYPYVKNGDPYIPIFQFICVPSSSGPYNKGIGHLLYNLALVTGSLLNMQVAHGSDNTYPITLVNVAQGQAANFFAKLAEASKAKAAGKRPFVAMEIDPNNPNAGTVQAQSLITQNLSNEWQLIYNTLLDEIQMLGINLKELTVEGNPTATEILSDEENSQSWVKQMMEYNVSETQEIIEVAVDVIPKFVSTKSTIPLNLTTKIDVDGVEVRPDNMTMGMLAKEFKENNYFVDVNGRSGAIPSNTMLRAKLAQVTPFVQPGTAGFGKVAKMVADLNDIDLSVEDFGAQAAPELPTMGGSETDRLSFNPRVDEQIPVG